MVPVPITSGQMLGSQHMAHVSVKDVPMPKKINSKDDWESITCKFKNAKCGDYVCLVSL